MSTPSTKHDDLFADFRAARGQKADEDWAMSCWVAMVMRGHVASGAADQALREALDLVRTSGEGAEELYGASEAWAGERIAEWAAQGSPALHDERAQWRELPAVAAIMGVVISLLLGIIGAVKGEWSIDWTPGWVLLPFVGSLIALTAMTTWERMVARHSVQVGAASAVGVVAVGCSAMGMVFALTNAHPLAHASIAWCLPLAGVHALLAWPLGRLIPSRPAVTTGMDDALWAEELSRILRTRGDTTETQVRQVVDEARSHAAAAHSTLEQEFGSPAAYATLVAPRPLVRIRRSMLYRLAMLALFVWLGWDEFGGGNSWPARPLRRGRGVSLGPAGHLGRRALSPVRIRRPGAPAPRSASQCDGPLTQPGATYCSVRRNTSVRAGASCAPPRSSSGRSRNRASPWAVPSRRTPTTTRMS